MYNADLRVHDSHSLGNSLPVLFWFYICVSCGFCLFKSNFLLFCPLEKEVTNFRILWKIRGDSRRRQQFQATPTTTRSHPDPDHGNTGSSGDAGFHPAPCISSEASWTRNRPPTCPYTWRIDSMEPLQGGLGWSKAQKVITNKRKASYQTLQGHKNSYPSKKNMKEHSVVNIWYWTSKKWRVANSSGFFHSVMELDMGPQHKPWKPASALLYCTSL